MKQELEWLKKYCGNKKVFGIPKNGLIVALLAGLNVTEDIAEAEIIVDDIVDSGRTIEPFVGMKDIAVLYMKPHSPYKDIIAHYGEAEDWVSFWWEGESDPEDTVRRMIEQVGENPNREGLLDTPRRVVKANKKIYEGYDLKPEDFMTVFENESKIDQIVGLTNIEFFSMCEHHMLPFFGKAHIFYIPDKKIVGISKLARILNMFSRRMQNQERIAKQVADVIEKYLKPKGVAVIIEAKHLCMMARGVEKQSPTMKTSELRGGFKKKQATREELFNLIK